MLALHDVKLLVLAALTQDGFDASSLHSNSLPCFSIAQ